MSEPKQNDGPSFFQRKHRNDQSRQQRMESSKTEHARLSQLIKNIFYLYIFANLFCLITLYTVSDEEIIKANARILVPILNIELPFVFFIASGSMVVFSLFIYLSIRFEELDKISAMTKLPYIFNSRQRATRQLTSFILYFLGPITIAMFAERAYLFRELDRMPAAVVFFIILSLLTYKKRSHHNFLVGSAIVLLLGLFAYITAQPKPVQLLQHRLDMGGQNLTRVQIGGYRLIRPIFNHTQLFESNIRDTQFKTAEFWGVNFSRSSIYNSEFTGVNAEYADFTKTIIRDVTFKGSNLKQVDFSDAVLFNVGFAATDPSVDSKGIRLPLEISNLSHAKFAATRLVSVKFDTANLANAEFINSDIQNSSFKDSLLTNVDFQTTTGLTCEQLSQAKSHEGIKLPYHLVDCFADEQTKEMNIAKPTKSKPGKKKPAAADKLK